MQIDFLLAVSLVCAIFLVGGCHIDTNPGDTSFDTNPGHTSFDTSIDDTSFDTIFSEMPLETLANMPAYFRFFPDVVRVLPDNFIPLDYAKERAEGALGFTFWSTDFLFYDIERYTIFTTGVKDNDFIVIYQNQYFINEDRFLPIYEEAMNIYEQFNRIYTLGDNIEIRGFYNGRRVTFNFTVNTVSRHVNDDYAVYEICFTVYPDISSGLAHEFFRTAYFKSGNMSHEFEIADDTSRTVTLTTCMDDNLELIILNIPSRRGFAEQSSERRIRIDESF